MNKVIVWHYNGDGRTYHNTKTQVSADGTNWTTVFDSATQGEYAETLAGKTHTFTQQNVRYVRDYLNGSTANSCNHWVEIELWVNDSKVQTWTNVASAWTTYNKTTPLSGNDKIDVVFTNDCSSGGYDRNLYIDYVIVNGTTIQAEGGAAIIDSGSGTAAFDGNIVVVGQQSLYGNSALRLVKGVGSYASGYDANGNLTSRVVDGGGWILGYDAENRLTPAQSSTTTATFAYDGDGNRVKATVGGVTTTYIGNYFEWTGSTSTMIKYYYAGATRVAMRVGSNTPKWLLSDHLGSQAITVSTNGLTEEGEVRYKAWGEDRFTSGTTPTSLRYTGQRSEMVGIGLYFYNARWYDPALSRWIQPDVIVPEAAQGVQAWDRYAYSNNSPVVHSDPSGHCIDGVTTILCIAMGVGALVGGAASVYNLYQNNDQVSAGQVVEAAIGGALGGAVLGGGLVIAGAAVAIGASALVGVGAAACTDGDCTNEGTALARSLGQAGETAAGIIKNTRRIPSATGTASYRIPDQWLETPKLISEVKNVAQLSLTNSTVVL